MGCEGPPVTACLDEHTDEAIDGCFWGNADGCFLVCKGIISPFECKMNEDFWWEDNQDE